MCGGAPLRGTARAEPRILPLRSQAGESACASGVVHTSGIPAPSIHSQWQHWVRIEQNGGVIELTEPQIWTLIGVFAAALVGMITFTTQVMWRAIAAQFASFRAEMRAEFAALRTETSAELAASRAEFTASRAETSAELAEIRAEIGSLRTEVRHLDRDVQAISRRVFPE